MTSSPPRPSAAIYEFPKPTIAMIRGYCVGGGVGLASCCDLRICSDNSRFAVPAAKLGLGYAYTGLKRLVDIVGQSFAKEIFYTARQFDAQEAHAMGLVNRVVPEAELESYVKSITDMICANAPLTIKAVKFTVGEILKDESKRDVARRRRRWWRRVSPAATIPRAAPRSWRSASRSLPDRDRAASAARQFEFRHSSDDRTLVIVALLAVAASLARQATKPSGRIMTAPDGDRS